MFTSRSGEYDVGVNIFSPQGRLLQVEYATRCTSMGTMAIGLKTKEGVIFAADRGYTTRLLEPTGIEKIMEIDEHIGCAVSGFVPDGRALVEHARVETQNHRLSYGEPMTVESTAQAIGDLALRFGESEKKQRSRPFGVALLIGGHDENGPSLYYTDPSGSFCQCNAKAIGSCSEAVDEFLQQRYNKDSTLKQAETLLISAMIKKDSSGTHNMQMATIAPTYHLLTPREVQVALKRYKLLQQEVLRRLREYRIVNW